MNNALLSGGKIELMNEVFEQKIKIVLNTSNWSTFSINCNNSLYN